MPENKLFPSASPTFLEIMKRGSQDYHLNHPEVSPGRISFEVVLPSRGQVPEMTTLEMTTPGELIPELCKNSVV